MSCWCCAFCFHSTYLCAALPIELPVSGGDNSCANPRGCNGRGLSSDSGLDAGSASRVEGCSAAEKEVGRGEARSAPVCQ
jgi:hypothetical protein